MESKSKIPLLTPILLLILVPSTVIFVTNYFVANPIMLNCDQQEALIKIAIPSIFQILFCLGFWVIGGLGLKGHLEPKTVWIVGFVSLLLNIFLLVLIGKFRLSVECSEFIMPNAISFVTAFIWFAFLSAILNNSFEKIRKRKFEEYKKRGVDNLYS